MRSAIKCGPLSERSYDGGCTVKSICQKNALIVILLSERDLKPTKCSMRPNTIKSLADKGTSNVSLLSNINVRSFSPPVPCRQKTTVQKDTWSLCFIIPLSRPLSYTLTKESCGSLVGSNVSNSLISFGRFVAMKLWAASYIRPNILKSSKCFDSKMYLFLPRHYKKACFCLLSMTKLSVFTRKCNLHILFYNVTFLTVLYYSILHLILLQQLSSHFFHLWYHFLLLSHFFM